MERRFSNLPDDVQQHPELEFFQRFTTQFRNSIYEIDFNRSREPPRVTAVGREGPPEFQPELSGRITLQPYPREPPQLSRDPTQLFPFPDDLGTGLDEAVREAVVTLNTHVRSLQQTSALPQLNLGLLRGIATQIHRIDNLYSILESIQELHTQTDPTSEE